MFSCEFCEVFKNTFFIEHLWWLLLIFEENDITYRISSNEHPRRLSNLELLDAALIRGRR